MAAAAPAAAPAVTSPVAAEVLAVRARADEVVRAARWYAAAEPDVKLRPADLKTKAPAEFEAFVSLFAQLKPRFEALIKTVRAARTIDDVLSALDAEQKALHALAKEPVKSLAAQELQWIYTEAGRRVESQQHIVRLWFALTKASVRDEPVALPAALEAALKNAAAEDAKTKPQPAPPGPDAAAVAARIERTATRLTWLSISAQRALEGLQNGVVVTPLPAVGSGDEASDAKDKPVDSDDDAAYEKDQKANPETAAQVSAAAKALKHYPIRKPAAAGAAAAAGAEAAGGAAAAGAGAAGGAPAPLRILTLDGGGVRGQIEAVVLRALWRAILKVCADNGVPPKTHVSDYFDVVYGTSTGGIMAVAIRKRLRLSAIADLYKTLPVSIFGRFDAGSNFLTRGIKRAATYALNSLKVNFPTAGLESALAVHLFGNNADARFKDLHVNAAQTGLAPFAVVAVNPANTAKPLVLRNFHTKESDPKGEHWQTAPELKCVHVMRATSAAPFYFPPQQLPGKNGTMTLVDGGLGHNHPGRCVLHHFGDRIVGKKCPVVWVALGTGLAQGFDPTKSDLSGLLEKVHLLGDCASTGDGISEDIANLMRALKLPYHRLQPNAKFADPNSGTVTRLGNVDLAECDAGVLSAMRKATRDWVRYPLVAALIEAAAYDLVATTV